MPDALVTRNYYTVATLPPASMFGGEIFYVTDLDFATCGANGTIAVGGGTTRCRVLSDGTNWRTYSPEFAFVGGGSSGGGSGSWVLISNTNINSLTATADFTGFDNTLYNMYELIVHRAIHDDPASNDDRLCLRTSSNGGASYYSDGSYGFAVEADEGTGGGVKANAFGTQNSIKLHLDLAGSNTMNFYATTSVIQFFEPEIASPGSRIPPIHYITGYYNSALSSLWSVNGRGHGSFNATKINAVRLFFQSFNIATLDASFYGRLR